MRRIMIAGTHSGCGKTTITCGILQALVNRKMNVSAFKCGPDYIDPMFHSRIIGTKSRNLDSFFTDKNTLNYLLYKNSFNKDISVIEGVMGFYDGIGDNVTSHSLACDTKTPVVIVINCKGMSNSIGAIIKGFLTYREPSNVVGFIFNRLHKSLCDQVKKICDDLNTIFLGYLPDVKEYAVESRHLGLVTAEEVVNLKNKMQLLASQLEETIDIDKLITISESAEKAEYLEPLIANNKLNHSIRIAVAMDKAFCFYYEDNLDLLRELQCDIIPFSPISDSSLPQDISGIIIGGGYPELYAKQLSYNKSMLISIKNAIASGIPTIAECGGFMYLHTTMENEDKKEFSMVGVIEGKAFKTARLQRFGYINMTAEIDNLLCKKGTTFPAHEFHYWDSTSCGSGFYTQKANKQLSWKCVNISENLYAGFPHLYFYSNPTLALNFVTRCNEYNKNIREEL